MKVILKSKRRIDFGT